MNVNRNDKHSLCKYVQTWCFEGKLFRFLCDSRSWTQGAYKTITMTSLLGFAIKTLPNEIRRKYDSKWDAWNEALRHPHTHFSIKLKECLCLCSALSNAEKIRRHEEGEKTHRKTHQLPALLTPAKWKYLATTRWVAHSSPVAKLPRECVQSKIYSMRELCNNFPIFCSHPICFFYCYGPLESCFFVFRAQNTLIWYSHFGTIKVKAALRLASSGVE